MTRDKIKNFFKSKVFIMGAIYTLVFFLAGFWRYLEFLIIPTAIIAFCILPVDQGFYLYLYTQAFYKAPMFMRPGIVTEVIFMVILLIKYLIGWRKHKYQLYKRLGMMIALFTVFSLIVSGFNKMVLYSIGYVFYLPVFYLVFATRKEYDLKKITRVLAAAVIISSVVSLGLWSVGTCYLNEGGIIRFKAFYGSPNTLYINALFALSCYMFMFFKRKIEFKEYIVIYFALASISLTSFSKANIVLLAMLTFISVVVYLFQDFKKHSLQVLVAILIATIVLVVFKDFTIAIITRFLRIDTDNFLNSLLTGRMDIWSAYIKDIFEDPIDFLFGHGMLSKYTYVPEQGWDRAQHNLYIFLLYKFGLIGIFFLGVIAWQFIVDSGKTSPKFVNFIPLIYFLVGGMVDNSFFYPQFYVIVAMALFATKNKSEAKEVEENKQVKELKSKN